MTIMAFLLGAISLLAYILWRMMRSDGWDDSNITNALRLLSHVVLHPEDFGKMYYLTEKQYELLGEESGSYPKRPFWYVSMDELSDVVRSRPSH